MLADRLMSKSDYDTDRELHTLELLKLRFGDTSLHDCEIMLKVKALLWSGASCQVLCLRQASRVICMPPRCKAIPS
jgi:hypothetical protein